MTSLERVPDEHADPAKPGNTRSSLRRVAALCALALAVPVGIGQLAPLTASAHPERALELRVSGAAGPAAFTPVAAPGQRVFSVDVADGVLGTARTWNPAGARVAARTGDQTRVVYGVDQAGVITSRTVLHTSTTVMPKTGQRPTQWAVSRSGVALSWWEPAGANVNFTVSVDGVRQASTTATTWTDHGSDPSAAHTYAIEGSRTVVSKGRTAQQPFHYEVQTDPSDNASVGLSISDARVSSASFNTDVAATEYPKQHAMLSYRAYIAAHRVATPKNCTQYYSKGYRSFAGDDRGWDSSVYGIPSSRLVGQSSMSFYKTYSTEDFYRHVGTTIAYDKKGKEKARKTASDTGIRPDTNNSGTKGRFEGLMTLSGTNPLCTPAPAIDGVLRYTVKSNGDFHILGNHDQAPNHEVLYLFFNGSKTVTGCAYHKALKGFEYLAGPLPDAYYDLSFNPIKKKKNC